MWNIRDIPQRLFACTWYSRIKINPNLAKVVKSRGKRRKKKKSYSLYAASAPVAPQLSLYNPPFLYPWSFVSSDYDARNLSAVSSSESHGNREKTKKPSAAFRWNHRFHSLHFSSYSLPPDHSHSLTNNSAKVTKTFSFIHIFPSDPLGRWKKKNPRIIFFEEK